METICFFNTAIAWGGGEKWHFETSSHLFSKGHRVLVVAHQKSVLLEKLKQTKIPFATVDVNNLSFLNPFKYLTIKRLLTSHGVTSIVLNLSRDVKLAGVAASLSGIKRIIYRRGSAIPIKNTFLNRIYFGKILTDVLANSEATKRTINQNNEKLFPNEKITVIYNGVDVSTINEKLRQLPKANTNVFNILTLGRLEYQKNQTFLIKVAKKLNARGIKFNLLIGGEGSLREKITYEIKENKLDHLVTLCGFIDDPVQFIAKADVFLLPSLWEGFGYVLAEAALCKKPIIAFALSSNSELVLNGKSGFLVGENDLDSFCEKIAFLAQNPEKRYAMGINGAEHVAKNFNKTLQQEKLAYYLING